MMHATYAIDDACYTCYRSMMHSNHAIYDDACYYSIYLYDARYVCYRSVTMNDNMLSIYYAISTMHSIVMVLYAECYLSMR